MQSGRELDLLVAEKVMGIAVDWANAERYRANTYDSWWSLEDSDYCIVPFYSTQISAAFEVVEKMKYREGVNITYVPFIGYRVQISNIKEFADTAPLAIVLAALKAKGVEV